jgi:hypothetical protein
MLSLSLTLPSAVAFVPASDLRTDVPVEESLWYLL